MNSASPSRLAFADTLRGLAALSVLISHFGYGFWLYGAEVARLLGAPVVKMEPPVVARAIESALPTSFFGHFGVALFFLISGFVIPLALNDRSRRLFLIGRVLRIWPTYVVGMTLTATVAWLCAAYFGNPRPFPLSTYGLQLVFLRDLFWVPSLDGIVWTLEIEAKFYLIAALLAPAFRGARPAPLLGFAAAAAGLTLLCAQSPDWLRSDATPYRLLYALTLSGQMICFMLIGSILQFFHRGAIGLPQTMAASVLLLACSFTQWPLGVIAGSAFSGIASYCAALGVFICAYAWRERLSRPWPVFRFLAAISYPLYVVHAVAGYAIMRIAIDRGASATLATGLATLYAFAAAVVLHRLVERPTQALSRPQRLGARLLPATGDGA